MNARAMNLPFAKATTRFRSLIPHASTNAQENSPGDERLVTIAVIKAAKGDLEARPSDLGKDVLNSISSEIVKDINKRHAQRMRAKAICKIKEEANALDAESLSISSFEFDDAMESFSSTLRKEMRLDPEDNVVISEHLRSILRIEEANNHAFASALIVRFILICVSVVLAFVSGGGLLSGVCFMLSIALVVQAIFVIPNMPFNREPEKVLSYGRKCARLIGSGACCTVSELSKHFRRSKRKTAEILDSVLEWGIFPEGCLDGEHNVLFLSQEALEEYESRLGIYLKRLENLTEAVSEGTLPNGMEGLDISTSTLVWKGRKLIRKIEGLRDSISDARISELVESVAGAVTDICTHIEKHPEDEPKATRIFDYMLPLTLKLIKTYPDLEVVDSRLPNVAQARNEIEAALELLACTYVKVLDGLHSSVALDIATDIDVLEVMVAQQGLADSAFSQES